jgi:hypothetical protein
MLAIELFFRGIRFHTSMLLRHMVPLTFVWSKVLVPVGKRFRVKLQLQLHKNRFNSTTSINLHKSLHNHKIHESFFHKMRFTTHVPLIHITQKISSQKSLTILTICRQQIANNKQLACPWSPASLSPQLLLCPTASTPLLGRRTQQLCRGRGAAFAPCLSVASAEALRPPERRARAACRRAPPARAPRLHEPRRDRAHQIPAAPPGLPEPPRDRIRLEDERRR